MENDIVEWGKIDTRKTKSYHACQKCGLKSSYHPNYLHARISGCVRRGCENMKVVAKRLLDFLEYRFISLDKNWSKAKVKFNCNKNSSHVCEFTFEDLRLGRICTECTKKVINKEKKPKKRIRKISPSSCECKQKGLGKNIG